MQVRERKMKTIEAIKNLVCYEQRDFIEQLLTTTKILQDEGLEVEIQYGLGQGTFTALIIGRRNNERDKQERNVGNAETGNGNTTKTPRQKTNK